MNKLFIIIILVFFPTIILAQVHSVSLTVHLRGVYESKISLMTQSGGSQLIKSISEKEGVNDGDTCIFIVPPEYLPGEFVLRCDYKQDESSNPYPSEKNFIINQQDLELWLQPIYSNNPDSTWFQEGELENAALKRFMDENYKQNEVLGLLQNFLMNYDDTQSEFYNEGILEYEKRRKAHNQWITDQIKKDHNLFVSAIYNFQYVPEVSWKGTQADRNRSYRDHYFDDINFNDSLLIRTRDLKSWMDQYVNLYGQEATTAELRDSLFTLAGKTAIEKAKKGNPKVYGWMVDYFYKGYESFNIEPGIAMLSQYLNDPDCLTSKRQAILKRVEGMKTLVPGSIAPDFHFTVSSGKGLDFHSYNPGTPYKLVLFWSADCPHCTDLVDKLYAWYKQGDHKNLVTVLAISLDETDTEVKAWEDYKQRLEGWIHIRANGGVNSPEADSYYILATPVMVLVDSKTNAIVSLPENLDQLKEDLK